MHKNTCKNTKKPSSRNNICGLSSPAICLGTKNASSIRYNPENNVIFPGRITVILELQNLLAKMCLFGCILKSDMDCFIWPTGSAGRVKEMLFMQQMKNNDKIHPIGRVRVPSFYLTILE